MNVYCLKLVDIIRGISAISIPHNDEFRPLMFAIFTLMKEIKKSIISHKHTLWQKKISSLQQKVVVVLT